MTTFNANTIAFDHFAPQAYVYPPRPDIKVAAFQVTDDNIGALSVDFESEIDYGVEDDGDLPYFTILAERWKDDCEDQITVREIDAYLNDWVVFMRGMIYVFKSNHFKATFATQRMSDVWVKIDGAVNWMDQEQADTKRAIEDVDRNKIVVRLTDGKDYYGITKQFDRDKRMYLIEFESGAHDWIEADRVRPDDRKPTPHPRRELPDLVTPIQFTAKTRVNWKGDEDGDGAILEGPNDEDQYFVKFDHGGAKWCHVADLQYLPQPVEEG